ncbi:hypothetical protein [uncultured Cyclobacterium sp.]|uniref:hypothetical protein n=1 Tax=uncultured Cyclobacterium sp. TaxID=453820 RepID=UPI0030EDE35D|tara:strand:- start:12883 stop:13713 length:831 start_codon:yes stop_codon:yes gene_type:complete
MLKSNKISKELQLIFILLLTMSQSCSSDYIQYPQFKGGNLNLSYQNSEHILLLLPKSNYNADTLAALLIVYDRAYELASEVSGREPDPSPMGMDKLPLAIVPSTCGSGCGRLGRKGIEITEEKFERIYDQFVKDGVYDHLFFYELGRNFWFYEASDVKLKEMDEIRTGFAVFLRDMLLSELKLNAAPINNKPYQKYMEDKKEQWRKMSEAWNHNHHDLENLRKKHFPKPTQFWSMLWWERYKKFGMGSIHKTLQTLQQHPPKSETDWLKRFTQNSR